jgi:hypothetical protein
MRGINPAQMWWPTVLGIEISCSQWEGSACTQSALICFLWSLGLEGGGEGRIFIFFICSQPVPFKFPMGSHQVPNMFIRFPMCFPRVFPIAPRFNPLCFAQSPPLLNYIDGPKGQALHLSIESSKNLGIGLHSSFQLFFFRDGPIKLAHDPQKKKNKKKNVGLVRHPN